MDVTSSIRSNVLSQSVVVTRIMDYWGRTGGISVALTYRSPHASSDVFKRLTKGAAKLHSRIRKCDPRGGVIARLFDQAAGNRRPE